ncbi:Lsr2 family protein [Acidothermaceae bacterium B102]|nr:Lsr2 family protein [Acidothermaceae bacterium B102]
MAKTVTTTISDDIDGSAGASELEFSYKGVAYTIDLGKKNAAALDKALKPYLEAATRVPGRGRAAGVANRPRRAVVATGRQDVAAIRAWAAKNGHEINSRGRIPQTVRDAYDTAKK